MYDEQMNFKDDGDGNKKTKLIDRINFRKVMWFVIGWLTIPFITGGIWYDMFGGLSVNEIISRLLHPKELLNALGIYTLTFIMFSFLPDKYRRANLFLKILYFILLYILLKAVINRFLW